MCCCSTGLPPALPTCPFCVVIIKCAHYIYLAGAVDGAADAKVGGVAELRAGNFSTVTS